MASIADIMPDGELKALLEGKVTIRKGPAEEAAVTVYRHCEMPNTGLPDCFIDITANGATRALAHPLGVFRGNLAVIVYCRARDNGAARAGRIREVVAQLEREVECRKSGRFFFKFSPSDVITPPTGNVATGYVVTVLNVEWWMDENG